MGRSIEQKNSQRANEIKYVHKHIVEGKTTTQCAIEMGITRRQLYKYRNGANYRKMALAALDERLDGVKGVMSKLLDSLDAKKPHNVQHKQDDGSIITEVKWVTDQSTRMKAIKEIDKIYGLHAPQEKNIRVAVSFSSDAELFAEIDEVARSRRFVESYVEGEGGFELAPDPQRPSDGDFKSRKRAVLQGASLPQ